MNNKNMRLWIIKICIALIIIIVAAAAAMSKKGDSGQETGITSESGIAADSNASMGSGDQVTQGSSMSDSHMNHSSHGGQVTDTDDLSRYLTEQDSIMMNMVEDTMIREKSGSASTDFFKDTIPHHEAAIKISESYLNHGGEVSDLQTLAQDIITTQKKELVQVNNLIKKYEEEGKKNQSKGDAYLTKYSEMFSDDSMSHHTNPSGVDNIDRAFTGDMIMHRQTAAGMAKDALDYTDKEGVKQLAQGIIDVREKKIEQMQKLIQK